MDILGSLFRRFRKEKLYLFRNRVPKDILIICILRIRNEELIIEDTLDHISSFADAIICYDDASTDSTFKYLKRHPKVIAIIRNFNWAESAEERIKAETVHRRKLLNLAHTFNPKWIFCADADERYIGDIRSFVQSEEAQDVDLIRISLFDAYLTPNNCEPYCKGQPLLNFRRYFGPERRDIVMLWKMNKNKIYYELDDSREPQYDSNLKVITRFYCQHYGKSLSVKHWEETCDYYINHFPYHPYGCKWEKRKGKAIHLESDFGTPLYEWGESLFSNAIKIHPR
ncbi:hypothetical protein HNQ34_001294 [Anoxybacillus tepidamans]|uniref:WsbG n=1 Tax=Anoxybacteroides tepidamans TaxID=265948 RepID=A2BD20_9BACL|nr:glycosyltransferase family 2 protein [Anoxybacillus tepidamans]ABM68320.1 WsbG [Anoxybacillus tepidamans]MBB5324201.1 hypothetical protein [Anoxybacillus tepidamans]